MKQSQPFQKALIAVVLLMSTVSVLYVNFYEPNEICTKTVKLPKTENVEQLDKERPTFNMSTFVIQFARRLVRID